MADKVDADVGQRSRRNPLGTTLLVVGPDHLDQGIHRVHGPLVGAFNKPLIGQTGGNRLTVGPDVGPGVGPLHLNEKVRYVGYRSGPELGGRRHRHIVKHPGRKGATLHCPHHPLADDARGVTRVVLSRYERAPKEATGSQAQDGPPKDNPVWKVAGDRVQGSPLEKIDFDVYKGGGVQGHGPALAVVGPNHLDSGIDLRLRGALGRRNLAAN
ncbi:MAG: hypothetical protein C4315_11180 [Chloroflexota bacterium]